MEAGIRVVMDADYGGGGDDDAVVELLLLLLLSRCVFQARTTGYTNTPTHAAPTILVMPTRSTCACFCLIQAPSPAWTHTQPFPPSLSLQLRQHHHHGKGTRARGAKTYLNPGVEAVALDHIRRRERSHGCCSFPVSVGGWGGV